MKRNPLEVQSWNSSSLLIQDPNSLAFCNARHRQNVVLLLMPQNSSWGTSHHIQSPDQ